MPALTFRTPTAADAVALAALGRSSFIDAFGHLYSRENLDLFLGATYSQTAVANHLADPIFGYRVAEVGADMVGYCKLGFATAFDFNRGSRQIMDLKQLYVAGDQTGGGIGAALLLWAIDEARHGGYDDILLSVWSGNIAAQRFYIRHGFEKWGETIFMVGHHKDDEYLFGMQVKS